MTSKNEIVEIVDADVTDLTSKPQNSELLDVNDVDTILYLAERADKYVKGLNRIMEAALKITTEYDWVLIGGKPYLQESGTTKVASLLGISIQLIGQPIVEFDNEGYKTFTYKARFYLKDRYVDCEGTRSMKEDFFASAGKGNPIKKPDEIDERDVRMAAYTNCLNNGIKRLIPNLRNIDISALEKAGLDTSKISGYTFKTGSKGGTSPAKAEESGLKCEMCGNAITQKVASYSQGKFGKALCYECQKGAKA